MTTIYVTKEINTEVEIELDVSDLISDEGAETFLQEIDVVDIIEHLVKRDSLPRLLRRIAEGLESVG